MNGVLESRASTNARVTTRRKRRGRIALALLVVGTCSSQAKALPDGHEWLPLRMGNEWTYSVKRSRSMGIMGPGEPMKFEGTIVEKVVARRKGKKGKKYSIEQTVRETCE